jgi:chlorosome envelope protein X
MALVRVQPLDIEFDAAEGESLMEAAERYGYRWPTLCGGVAMCTMCWARVESGAEHLSPMQEAEREALETYRREGGGRSEGHVRLGCQVKVYGPATFFKRGVNAAGRAGTYR